MPSFRALTLAAAAVLEIGGDAAIRRGLMRSEWPALALGALLLLGYGLTVNLGRIIDFGRLMGLYIAMFFLVSQLLSFLAFGDRPSPSLWLGGALIVTGGIVIQLGTR